jgi:hypothetical protein
MSQSGERKARTFRSPGIRFQVSRFFAWRKKYSAKTTLRREEWPDGCWYHSFTKKMPQALDS